MIISLKINLKNINLKKIKREKNTTKKENIIPMNVVLTFYKKNAKMAFCLAFP
jgi:uncharacterized protein involved in tellurium resistance